MNYAVPLPLRGATVRVPMKEMRGATVGVMQAPVVDSDGMCIGVAIANLDAQKPLYIHYWHYNKLQVN